MNEGWVGMMKEQNMNEGYDEEGLDGYGNRTMYAPVSPISRVGAA